MLRGGRIFALGLLGLVKDNHLLEKVTHTQLRATLEHWFEEEKDEDTGEVTGYVGYLDEIIGYLLAAVGIYVQIASGFKARATASVDARMYTWRRVVVWPRACSPCVPTRSRALTMLLAVLQIFFPLNLVLLPLSALEWFLRYQVMFGAVTHIAG